MSLPSRERHRFVGRDPRRARSTSGVTDWPERMGAIRCRSRSGTPRPHPSDTNFQ